MSSLRTLPKHAYTVSITDDPHQVRAAQQLRTEVFRDELGATLPADYDTDELDAVCDHLIVEDQHTGNVVGTYRLLPPNRTRRLYSEAEFDVTNLDPLRESLIEAGRSCVHPEHRDGTVITLMWSALARYAMLSGHRYLAGCASVPLADGGTSAAATWQLAAAKHAAPAELRVRPHRPWQPGCTLRVPSSYKDMPPLVRGYFRLGAWVCGPPAHDPDFNVADFFVLLPLDRVDDRYRRFFLGATR